MLLPRIEKIIEEQNDKINLVKVDIDDNAEIAMKYGVSLSLINKSIFKHYSVQVHVITHSFLHINIRL